MNLGIDERVYIDRKSCERVWADMYGVKAIGVHNNRWTVEMGQIITIMINCNNFGASLILQPR